MVHLEPVFYILVSSSIGVPAVFFINKMKYVCFWEHTLYTLEIECSSHALSLAMPHMLKTAEPDYILSGTLTDINDGLCKLHSHNTSQDT